MEEQRRRDQDAFRLLEKAGIDVSDIGLKKPTMVKENETLLQRIREDRVVKSRDNYGHSNPVVSVLTSVFAVMSFIVVALLVFTVMMGIAFVHIISAGIKGIRKLLRFR